MPLQGGIIEMTDFRRKLIARLLGVFVLAVGAVVGWLGLNEHARRMGGPESSWVRTPSEIVRVQPNPRYEDRVQEVYSFTAPNGREVTCPVSRDSDDPKEVGDTQDIYVRIDTSPGYCRIATENLDAGFTGAHFMMVFAFLWMAMGAAFILRPPGNVGVGGGGGGTFGGSDGGGGGGDGF